ncbi:hypothetical protein GOBAR_DD22169 [Gossypium barbadense]|nr:hypothetical protein GOBAR_DD22169 [Gossypium barbadense]
MRFNKRVSLADLKRKIKDGDEGSDNDDQSHRDPNDDFSDPNLDDILEDIDEEGSVQGENANPHSDGNTGLVIVIRNNSGSFMTDVDPDTALVHEFPEYTNIMSAHLLDDEFYYEEFNLGKCWKASSGCNWRVQAALMQWTQMWMIRKLEGSHTCTSAHMSQDHQKLDAKTICNCIIPLVKELPTIQVSVLITDMQARFKYKVSYRKAWWQSKWRCESCIVTGMRHTTTFNGG